MKINDLTIKNKHINVEHINMDLENNGVYLITGPVGCGKSTLIETIVFNGILKNITFQNDDEKNKYVSNRFNLITYIPQNYPVYKIKVIDYITKWNSGISLENIDSYFAEFGLDQSLLNKPFNVLSGGEQVKISIITGLLKDAPYIFMDEPTNNLDDGCVAKFNEIVQKVSKSKKIIIISHDPRLKVSPNIEYSFQNGVLIEVDNYKNVINVPTSVKYPHNANPSMSTLVFKMLHNYAFLCSLFIISIFLASVACYTHFYFQDNINTEEYPAPEYIAVYYNGGYDDLNGTYAKGEGLHIDESMYDSNITYADIEDVSLIEGMEDIYLKDEQYLAKLNEKIQNGEVSDDINILSVPNFIIDEFWDITSIDFALQFTEGKLPKDDANEVAISKNLLKKYYGYDDTNVDNAIGDKIYLVDLHKDYIEECTITGFTYFDIAVVSYNDSSDFGVYRYSKDTFSDFKSKQDNYISEIDSFEGLVWEVLISTKAGYEQKVLNELMQQYPANHYYSSHYAKVWTKEYNSNARSKILLLNIVFSAVMSVALVLINKNAMKYNIHFLLDVGNYYLNRDAIFVRYNFSLVGCVGVIVLLVLSINTLLSNYFQFSNSYIVVNAMILMLPILFTGTYGYRRNRG